MFKAKTISIRMVVKSPFPFTISNGIIHMSKDTHKFPYFPVFSTAEIRQFLEVSKRITPPKISAIHPLVVKAPCVRYIDAAASRLIDPTE